jgi:hypothetical protein
VAAILNPTSPSFVKGWREAVLMEVSRVLATTGFKDRMGEVLAAEGSSLGASMAMAVVKVRAGATRCRTSKCREEMHGATGINTVDLSFLLVLGQTPKPRQWRI